MPGDRVPIESVFIQPEKLIANGYTPAAEVTDGKIRAPHEPLVAERLDDRFEPTRLGDGRTVAPDTAQPCPRSNSFDRVMRVEAASGMGQDHAGVGILFT